MQLHKFNFLQLSELMIYNFAAMAVIKNNLSTANHHFIHWRLVWQTSININHIFVEKFNDTVEFYITIKIWVQIIQDFH